MKRMKYRGLMVFSVGWFAIAGILPLVNEWSWKQISSGDPRAQQWVKGAKPIHDFIGQVFGLVLLFRPLAVLSFLLFIALVAGNAVVDERLTEAAKKKHVKNPRTPRELTRQEWLDAIFHQDEVDFEALARRQAVKELRELDVLQTPAEHSSIGDPAAPSGGISGSPKAAVRRSKRKHGRPTPSGRKNR